MRLYGTRGAAKYCLLSYEAFRQHIKRGTIVPDTQVSGRHAFNVETLDRFIASSPRKTGWVKGRPRKNSSS